MKGRRIKIVRRPDDSYLINLLRGLFVGLR
jgi:hypothetical protein